MSFVFEPLMPQHDLTPFRCGNSMLDTYLKQEARQEVAQDLARVFVALDEEKSLKSPVGYVALKTTGYYLALLEGTAPSDRYLYPAEIAYLARDLSQHGKDLGGLLVVEALRRIELASRHTGLPGVFLTATREGAALYASFGFRLVDEREREYYMPMGDVRDVLEEFGAQ